MKKMTDKSPIIINNTLLLDQLMYFTRPDLQYALTGEVMEFYRIVKNAMYKNTIILYNDIDIYYAVQSDTGRDKSIYIIFESIADNEFRHIYIDFDLDNGYLKYETETETPLTADNVKTLFGNQSIIGTGNIDLYRHEFELATDDGVKHYYEHISSNRLVCDSLQDLTTVLKPLRDDNDYYALSDNVTLNFSAGVWYIGNFKVVQVVDKVTTI